MPEAEERSVSPGRGAMGLALATLMFVALALGSHGWPALVWAVLAVGFATGIVADAICSTDRESVAPPVRHRQRPAA